MDAEAGDAFLAQQPQVMASVQKLRKKALDAGNLKDSEQQKIISETARPRRSSASSKTNPQVVYVPVYSNTWVYGAGGIRASALWLLPDGLLPILPGNRFYYGAAWGLTVGWVAGANWNHAQLYVNNNYTRINNINIQGSGNKAQTLDQNGPAHLAARSEHRKSVPYADRATQNKFEPAAASAATRQQDYRGYDNAARPANLMNSVSPAARDQLQDRAASMTPEQRRRARAGRIGCARGTCQSAKTARLRCRRRNAPQSTDRPGASACLQNNLQQQRTNPACRRCLILMHRGNQWIWPGYGQLSFCRPSTAAHLTAWAVALRRAWIAPAVPARA